jgi:hypothetical protein
MTLNQLTIINDHFYSVPSSPQLRAWIFDTWRRGLGSIEEATEEVSNRQSPYLFRNLLSECAATDAVQGTLHVRRLMDAMIAKVLNQVAVECRPFVPTRNSLGMQENVHKTPIGTTCRSIQQALNRDGPNTFNSVRRILSRSVAEHPLLEELRNFVTHTYSLMSWAVGQFSVGAARALFQASHDKFSYVLPLWRDMSDEEFKRAHKNRYFGSGEEKMSFLLAACAATIDKRWINMILDTNPSEYRLVDTVKLAVGQGSTIKLISELTADMSPSDIQKGLFISIISMC